MITFESNRPHPCSVPYRFNMKVNTSFGSFLRRQNWIFSERVQSKSIWKIAWPHLLEILLDNCLSSTKMAAFWKKKWLKAISWSNLSIVAILCLFIWNVYFYFFAHVWQTSDLMYFTHALVSNYNYNSLIMRIHETLMLLYIIAGIACSLTDSLQYIVFKM